MRTRFLLSSALVVVALGLTGGRLSAQGATSVCKDGTKSATTGKGACSGHGGVDTKATAAAKKGAAPATSAAKTATPPATAATPPAAAASKTAAKTAPATAAKTSPAAAKTTSATKTASASDKDSVGAVASCKDGTYSHASTHKGACSRHGGVAKFLKP
jgi:hypothetical protein